MIHVPSDFLKEGDLNPQLPLPYIQEALFKCEDIETLGTPFYEVEQKPNPGYKDTIITKSSNFLGAILARKRTTHKLILPGESEPTSIMLPEEFIFYGVHFFIKKTKIDTPKGYEEHEEHSLSLERGADQYFASPVSDKGKRVQALPDPFSKIPNFNVVFFHPFELYYLTTFHTNPKQEFVHVSRAIVDYGNGQQYQTLKLRPEPDPVPLAIKAVEDQMGDVAYLIGNSCPPTWRELWEYQAEYRGEDINYLKWMLGNDPSSVTSVKHGGKTFRVSKTMLNLLLTQKHVPFVQFDPSWPPPPRPEEYR